LGGKGVTESWLRPIVKAAFGLGQRQNSRALFLATLGAHTSTINKLKKKKKQDMR